VQDGCWLNSGCRERSTAGPDSSCSVLYDWWGVIPGERLGRYTLLGKLATGGMAEVYLARQDGPQGFVKTLVVKRILPQYGRDEAFVRMFLDEARLAAQINHPNVVSIIELGEDPASESYFMAMEFIDGCSLKRVIHQAMRRGEPLPVALCCRILSDACGGLDHAHNLRGDGGRPLQIVHRDVSPENILVTYSGLVKVVDFGIAKATSTEGRTRAGQLKGKFSYMPPEQLLGQPVDRRADIWALGVVLYWMCCGAKPFTGDSEPAVVQRILATDPQPLDERAPHVPGWLAAIARRALEKNLERRYASAREMQLDLDAGVARAGLVASSAALSDYLAAQFPENSDPDRLLSRALQSGEMRTATPSGADVPFPTGATRDGRARPRPSDPAEPSRGTTVSGEHPRAAPSRPASAWRWGIAGAALASVATGAFAVHALGGRSPPASHEVATIPSPAPPPAALPPLPAPPPPVARSQPVEAALTPSPAVPPRPTSSETAKPARRHAARAAEAPGLLAFRVVPWAEVVVDDQPIGTTPLRPLELSAGRHHVRLVNATLHVDRQLTVEIRPGETAVVKEHLGDE